MQRALDGDVSLDGVRNDGATGENDDVRTSVEIIGGSNFRDTLTGNGSANVIDGFGDNDTIDGLGGNDTLSAGAGTINGVAGGAGNDVVFARNFARDNIDCGENSAGGASSAAGGRSCRPWPRPSSAPGAARRAGGS